MIFYICRTCRGKSLGPSLETGTRGHEGHDIGETVPARNRVAVEWRPPHA